ncbi:MAG: SCO1664 family protein [Acidimicrobiales bacterium]
MGESAGAPPNGAAAGHRPLLATLSSGEIELRGRLPWSSNATFLVAVRPPPGVPGPTTRRPAKGARSPEPGGGAPPVLAIYKPARGERPLWDFPRGLWKREVAAYELSRFLGWGIVPPTTARPDGPLGPGSLQYFVDALFDEHYFTLLETPDHRRDLRRIAVFDVVANNADRKSGHCLIDREGHIWGIDHGLCFHAEPKLRTVIWDFAGEKIEKDLLASLGTMAAGSVPEALTRLLGDEEIGALRARAAALLASARFPEPSADFPYPWPLV